MGTVGGQSPIADGVLSDLLNGESKHWATWVRATSYRLRAKKQSETLCSVSDFASRDENTRSVPPSITRELARAEHCAPPIARYPAYRRQDTYRWRQH